MLGMGFWRTLAGQPPVAESAGFGYQAGQLSGLALAALLLRSFASGCTALTGVEAVSNGVPAFRRPKSRNAARTLSAMAALAITMMTAVGEGGRARRATSSPSQAWATGSSPSQRLRRPGPEGQAAASSEAASASLSESA